ncbi:hypothetical protein RvY_18600 [Ramazzottius varieornatus]|uniref:Uncharacterized protein n=1 Tax=Ramazzottius varieornatus TaxID=947166 RepID=A0A1D1W9J0_RAMVA|nr:hypothetical protein RvY_18600 [Ramazzottius varieornatus]
MCDMLNFVAIKCFVCDNKKGHADEDGAAELVPNILNFVNQTACHRYADTKELRPFSVDCPAKYNACQATVGYVHKPDAYHAYRGCYTIAPGGDMSTTCRNHTYVPNQAN